MRGSNIHYELSDKIGATSYGGVGAMHTMVQRLGLVEEIDQHLELLKIHLPYHESDHVLNVAYNILSGGERLEDIELRRQDESFLNGLGALIYYFVRRPQRERDRQNGTRHDHY